MAPQQNEFRSTSVLASAAFLKAMHAAQHQEEDEVCLYPSKKCTNLRAKKKNGELHTMCEYHRIRANENQRRLERRRKAALRFPHRHVPKPTLWNKGFPEPIPMPMTPVYDPARPRVATTLPLPCVKRHDLLTHWQPIEVEILMACLFDVDDTQRQSGPPPTAEAASWQFPAMAATAHTVNLAELV